MLIKAQKQESDAQQTEEEAKALIDEEFATEDKKHQKIMQQPGVVPGSDKFLDQED